MTGAEFRTLRESLGLSGDQLAQLLDVRDRTVRRWEAGDQAVPDGAGEDLARIDAMLERAVLEMVDVLQEQIAEHGAPQSITLVRYRTDEDLGRYRPDMAAWPACVHSALVDRVRLAAARLGIASRIVYMDRESYDAWRERRKDSEALRAAWAAEQISGEA